MATKEKKTNYKIDAVLTKKRSSFDPWNQRVLIATYKYGWEEFFDKKDYEVAEDEDENEAKTPSAVFMQQQVTIFKDESKQVSEKRRACFAALHSSIHIDFLYITNKIKVGDVHGLNSKICNHFHRATSTCKRAFIASFHALKMKSGDNFDEFVAKLDRQATILDTLGQTVTEDAKLCQLLHALPSTYESMRQALEMDRDLTYESAVEKLSDKANDDLSSKPEANREQLHVARELCLNFANNRCKAGSKCPRIHALPDRRAQDYNNRNNQRSNYSGNSSYRGGYHNNRGRGRGRGNGRPNYDNNNYNNRDRGRGQGRGRG